LEVLTTKQPIEVEHMPTTPPPSSVSPTDGMEEARALGRRYLPDLVRSWAAIALGEDSEASLHTKFLAGNAIASIAGAIPQPTPTPPNGGGSA
jgi:hypothetical protein